MRIPLKFRTLTGLAALAVAGPLQAASLTWDDSGLNPVNPVDGFSSLWSTSGANWSNGVTDSVWNNANNDIAVFGNGNGAAGTVNLGSNITVNGLVFNAPGSGTYNIGPGTGFSLTLAGATPTITTNVNAEISAVITGTGPLIKAGSGVLTLSGMNTYTGGTRIDAGVLSFSNKDYLPVGSITLNGGTLRFTGSVYNGVNRPLVLTTEGGTIESAGTASGGYANFTGTITYSGSGNRTLTLAGYNPDTNSGTSMMAVIADGVGGATSLVKNGAGTWNLTAANTYTGTTTINQGQLSMADAGSSRLPVTTSLYIDTAGTLNLARTSQTIVALYDGSNGGGTITNNYANGAASLTVGGGAFTGTIRDGNVNRATAISKNTTGVLRLSGGNSSYSGGTTVSSGTLLINNTAGSGWGVGAVVVTNATVGGNGYSVLTGANSITVGSGGIVNAGDVNTDGGIGTLTLNGGSTTGAILNMQANSGFVFDLGAANANDLVRFYNYAGASDFLRDGSGVTISFTGAQAGTYDLFRFYSNTGTTLAAAGFDESTANFVLGSGLDGYTATWDYGTTGVISLTLTAVPEPSTLVLLGLGLGAGWMAVRRKRA